MGIQAYERIEADAKGAKTGLWIFEMNGTLSYVYIYP